MEKEPPRVVADDSALRGARNRFRPLVPCSVPCSDGVFYLGFLWRVASLWRAGLGLRVRLGESFGRVSELHDSALRRELFRMGFDESRRAM
jgi:hypothetical protein